MTMSGTPSCAISRACAWRSWCGAKRRRTPAVAATRRIWARAAAGDHGRPRVGPVDDAQQRADRELEAHVKPGPQLLPGPLVHADLAAAGRPCRGGRAA